MLITRDRALKGIANPAGADKSRLDVLILSASDAIEKYCQRKFVAADYLERYSGGREILLNQTPVNSISRVSTWRTGALRIENTSDSNQIARVTTTSTGLSLTRIASGVTTTSTLLFADYVTLSALATAITALGNGWTGEVVASEFSNWPSSYLYSKQGPQNAKGAVYLYLFDEDVDEVELVDDQAGIVTGCFGKGCRNILVAYNAGYTQNLDNNINNVPQDVQQACAMLTAWNYSHSEKDPVLRSERLGDYQYDKGFQRVGEDIPLLAPEIRALLDPYKRTYIGGLT